MYVLEIVCFDLIVKEGVAAAAEEIAGVLQEEGGGRRQERGWG
jgi:hypothetical protein